VYAHELYQAVQAGGRYEALAVAKTGPPFSADVPHDGTRFGRFGPDPNEYSLFTGMEEYDRLLGTMHSKELYVDEWRKFLKAVSPDLVHFQHTHYLGYDILRATRATLPDAPIVYTLHEFIPICHHSGQMVRRFDSRELCHAASPRRCNECYPEISPQRFFLRERFVKSAFDLVDVFITPSQHARQRYIEWGLPAEKVVHEDYGRFPVVPHPDPPDAGRRGRIGFIGQITPFKGLDVLLEAMKLLQAEEVTAELLIYGANLTHQPDALKQQIETLLSETEQSVRFLGSYVQEQLPAILSGLDWVVVPSIWWETGPLVIHEALMHRRPVICSDIGSMVERITDGANGLLFAVGNPDSLAAAIRRAVSSPELWDRVRSQITDPHPMEEHLPVIYGLYDGLLDGSRARLAAA
jgi:glycosyltransferase involved in cell wall biosynthesis